MKYLPLLFVVIVAIEHLYFLAIEMFFWTKPRTLKAFGITKEEAEVSQKLAANQGLYNGFIAAGLIWSLMYPIENVATDIQLFFLFCVITAAVYAGFTVKKSIFFVQGIPAILAVILICLF